MEQHFAFGATLIFVTVVILAAIILDQLRNRIKVLETAVRNKSTTQGTSVDVVLPDLRQHVIPQEMLDDCVGGSPKPKANTKLEETASRLMASVARLNDAK